MANVFVLMGPQGAGKGTQAQMLARAFSLPIIATGDMLREVARQETELGRLVHDALAAGHLVSDEILAEVVSQRAALDDCKNGFILDGFPRTLPQAQLLDKLAAECGYRIVVIKIDVPMDMINRRLAGRRVCSKCNTVYNMFFKPPKHDEVCDLDGAPLVIRHDDRQEVIEQRLALYTEKTKPILDYYEATGRLRRVRGDGTPEEAHAEIAAIVREAQAAGGPSGAGAPV